MLGQEVIANKGNLILLYGNKAESFVKGQIFTPIL